MTETEEPEVFFQKRGGIDAIHFAHELLKDPRAHELLLIAIQEGLPASELGEQLAHLADRIQAEYDARAHDLRKEKPPELTLQ